jgi:hypothetical protein
VSVEDQGTIMALIELDKDNIGTDQLRDAFIQAQEVLMRVAQYSQPIREVQMVCEHPQQIIDLQRQITDLQTKQFLPVQWDHTEREHQIPTLRNERDEALRRPSAPGTKEELGQELDDMTRDARQSGEEVRGLRMQLANALTLAAGVALAAPQAPEDRGQKFPDSPDFSGSDRTQLRGWIAQLWIVIRHKPTCFPEEQSKMRNSFNRLRGIAFGQSLPHVRENGTIGLEDLPAFIQLLEAAVRDPDLVATAERKMPEIKQKNRKFSQYYTEFQVIAADLDWNPSALRNAPRMGLSEEMKDSFTYSDMPEELPAFVTVCQKRDNQIRQRQAEKVAQNKGSGIGSASSRPALLPKAPETVPAGTIARYTGPAPMDLSAGKRRISAEERAKRFADGRCLYCGGFNHRAAECAARKKAQTFKAAGAKVKEVGTKEGSKESGKD